MPLPNILRPPSTPNGMDEWRFAHMRDHVAVVDLIRQKLNVILPVLVLDPMDPGSPKSWAQRHQDMHDNANGVLAVAGTDLQSVEWEDKDERENWFWNNFQEHSAWHKRLGL